ncbi:calmodulin-regulated spectrin-associated protein 1-B isoform X1 [Oncorhynchus tshawytscha]|uniref:Calmodulin-regulated spectrin-associated protein 1-B-like n=1 Tax=Oncorhynchus tshawytscha TaxID=74940 RepID=A0AAZ3S8T4_ONCTS|nr:calmodulin-regulated spectrin-associated protein 1-B isoform X1 [Oncorhynchus tshawytscha]
MDLDVCAGGNSTKGKADSAHAGEGGAMATVPLELYDSARAKIDANLRWLLAKAYGIDHIPEDLCDPFYTDQYEQEHIKPPVIRLLLSGELYCRVCGLILKGEQASALQSHLSVIQALSRKGIYVLESDNNPVSDGDLDCIPIKMSSHIPLIDSLMMAYTVEMISIEQVVGCVKRFSTFSASKELPFDLEDAMVFWINKVNMKMKEITEKETKIKQHLLESPSHQKVRYRRDNLSGQQLQHFPMLGDLMKDMCDGAALLSVVHFYCPECMRLEDICLKVVSSVADSLYNIQLLREFCNEYLNRSFHLRPEDVLYAPPVLKHNVMVFIAELFWWFEILKPDFVQPRDLQEVKDVRSLLQPKDSRPHVSISNATKRNFLATPGSPDIITTSQSPDICNSTKVSPASSPSHLLLPLRQKQQKSIQENDASGQRNRSNSLSRVDSQVQESSLAWPERRQRPLSQPVPYALHFPLERECDGLSLAHSISKDSLGSNIISITPKHMPGGPGMGVQLPPHRLNGQDMMAHIRFKDKEMEEEELVAIIHPAALARCYGPRASPESDEMEQDDLEVQSEVTSRVSNARHAYCLAAPHPDPQPESFYLEPLMPAVFKTAKEKSISLNKEEESGESTSKAVLKRTTEGLNCTFTPIPNVEATSGPFRPPTKGGTGSSQLPLMGAAEPITRDQSCGFFLHLSPEPGYQTTTFLGLAPSYSPFPTAITTAWVGRESCSEIANLEEEEEEEEQMELAKEVVRRVMGKCLGEGGESKGEPEGGEGESAKLREDMKVCEREDKEGLEAWSGPSSPCLSTASWASSVCNSGTMRMTSFAERKLHRKVNSFPDDCSNNSSSQKTTPDGSESAPYTLGGLWCLQAPSPCRLAKDGALRVRKEVGTTNVLASELVQLHMQLEEQRRSIEHQKKKLETISACQRLKLGKAAFLNIVKKGGGKNNTLPQPLKHLETQYQTAGKDKACRDDSCLDVLKGQRKEGQQQRDRDNRTNSGGAGPPDEAGVEPGLSECSRSIELLNEAISAIQQQMMQLSLQQDRLIKQSVQSPLGVPHAASLLSLPSALTPTQDTSSIPSSDSTVTPTDSKFRPAVRFMETITTAPPARRPPKLSSGCSPRTKPAELKLTKENGRPASKTSTLASNTDPRRSPGWHTTSRGGQDRDQSQNSSPTCVIFTESPRALERGTLRSTTFKIRDDANQRSHRDGPTFNPKHTPPKDSTPYGTPLTPHCVDAAEGRERSGSGKEIEPGEEGGRGKGQLIEVDLSDLKEPSEGKDSDIGDTSADGEQKSGLGFFFKDDEKMAEDERAKRRAHFLLKQQRKMDEARLRKLQTEAESEQKRDEARRKAEEDRVRKEEEKVRRELIKQDYLRRKQQELIEEQGLVKPRCKARKTRPKSLHRGESCSDTGFSKGSSTRYSLRASMLMRAQGSAAGSRGEDIRHCFQSGSTLSLATETVSVTFGGAKPQRRGSVESFPLLSMNSSRNMERDWENGSTASSITSTVEYNGPKLFKECVSKSNKPIIHNAITHCCLAGKVNEAQKNTILEELERCEANHLMILFRDGSCQFRAIYSFSPDTEEIVKFTGMGPRSISRKMIDKLYKYSSDRKQFNCIPAKTVSVSVDALTIHNHLWQIKRPSGSSRKK